MTTTMTTDGELRPMIDSQLRYMQAMIHPNGAVIAAPSGGDYNAHWVRDGLYVLTGAVYLGLNDLAHRLIRAPFSIFHKHRAKILAGIRRKPDENFDFLHARYHPAHFDQFTKKWGHNQLDMVGLFLYLVAKLPAYGIDVYEYARHQQDKLLLNHITRYLETLEWWRCEDHGVWEEREKQNASSIGAVLAGLKAISALDDPDFYFNEAQLAKGQKALDDLLPNEARERKYDLAQLSLIWPFGVVNDEQAHTILARIEEKLVRPHGVIRYRSDAYFNAADPRLIVKHDPRTVLDLVDYSNDQERESFPHAVEGAEAQWPLGFAWLSIVYSKLAKARFAHHEDHRGFADKARYYLDRLRSCAVPIGGEAVGCIPELYVDGKPNANTPLTWSTSFAIVAAVAYSEIEDPVVPYSVL